MKLPASHPGRPARGNSPLRNDTGGIVLAVYSNKFSDGGYRGGSQSRVDKPQPYWGGECAGVDE
jgi:hypothetical protein